METNRKIQTYRRRSKTPFYVEIKVHNWKVLHKRNKQKNKRENKTLKRWPHLGQWFDFEIARQSDANYWRRRFDLDSTERRCGRRLLVGRNETAFGRLVHGVHGVAAAGAAAAAHTGVQIGS